MRQRASGERSRLAAARWIVRGLAVTVPVTFVALLAYGVMAQAPNTTIDDNLSRGHAVVAPSFRLAVLERGSLGPVLAPRLARVFDRPAVALSDLRGTPIVLNIWASWCVPCQQEAPTLERAWSQQARPRGVLFLGLDMQDVTTDGQTFMRHYGVDYPNIRDPGNDIPRAYGATGVPETFFISAQGRIAGHISGVGTSQQFAAGISAALSGRARGAFAGGPQGALR